MATASDLQAPSSIRRFINTKPKGYAPWRVQGGIKLPNACEMGRNDAQRCLTFAGVVANPRLGVPVPDQAAADEEVILGAKAVVTVEPVQAELLVRGACSPILDTAKVESTTCARQHTEDPIRRSVRAAG